MWHVSCGYVAVDNAAATGTAGVAATVSASFAGAAAAAAAAAVIGASTGWLGTWLEWLNRNAQDTLLEFALFLCSSPYRLRQIRHTQTFAALVRVNPRLKLRWLLLTQTPL